MDTISKKRKIDEITNLTLFRAIREPFALPLNSQMFHKCEWEAIDGKLHGCKLCGNIHVCGRDCKKTIQIEDGLVCEISGLVIQHMRFEPESEFFDTVLWTEASESGTRENLRNMTLISEYVQDLLTSNTSRDVHAFIIEKMKASILKATTLHWQRNQNKANYMDFIEIFKNHLKKNNVMLHYNLALRREVATRCAKHIKETIGMCCSNFRLNIKAHEMRNTVFGLLYLMRDGINFANTCIVPGVEYLRELLPPESTLMRFYKFKSKYITDIENKCKYNFRIKEKISSKFKDFAEFKSIK